MPLSGLFAQFVKWSRLGRTAATQETPQGPRIGRKEVRKRLVATLQPLLMAQGFERFDGRVARRRREAWVDVVEVDFIRSHYTTSHSPSLHIGRHLTYVTIPASFGPVSEKNGRICPDVTQCHLRKTIYKRSRQAGNPMPNIWNIGPHGEGLGDCADEMACLANEEILPWFAWLNDLRVLLDLIDSGKGDMEGKSPDPLLRGTWNLNSYWNRHVLAGLTEYRLGNWEACIARLAPVVKQGGILGYRDKLIALSSDAIASLDSVIAESREKLARAE